MLLDAVLSIPSSYVPTQMFYLPLSIFATYMYIAARCSRELKERPDNRVMRLVLLNIMLSELTVLIGWATFLTSEKFSMFNLIMWYITQDFYFYIVHRWVFHKYLSVFHNTVSIPLSYYSAWRKHPVEHVVLNLGSIMVSFWLFPNSTLVMYLVMLQQIFTSVSNHRPDAQCQTDEYGTCGICSYVVHMLD